MLAKRSEKKEARDHAMKLQRHLRLAKRRMGIPDTPTDKDPGAAADCAPAADRAPAADCALAADCAPAADARPGRRDYFQAGGPARPRFAPLEKLAVDAARAQVVHTTKQEVRRARARARR